MGMKKMKQITSLRNESIELLISNEEKYVSILECIARVYKKPLENILTPLHHKQIFYNINHGKL